MIIRYLTITWLLMQVILLGACNSPSSDSPASSQARLDTSWDGKSDLNSTVWELK